MKKFIRHWRFVDDQVSHRGYYAWVYEYGTNNINFEKWMADNMSGEYRLDWKFNGGDPLMLLFIKRDEDATIFKLRWGDHICEAGEY